MPNRASLSIAGLYSWDSHIFDLMVIPSGMNRQQLIDNILLECSELTVIYPDWNFMQKAIGSWSAKELEIWNKVYDLEHLEYNPIENYDRFEDESENIAEKKNENEQTGSTGNTLNIGNSANNNTDTQNSDTVNSVAGFNSNSLAPQSQSENNTMNIGRGTQQTSNLSKGTASEMTNRNGINNQSRNRSSRIHGNIGVTTTQQMMQQELDILPKVHIDDYIISSFKERFCILVY